MKDNTSQGNIISGGGEDDWPDRCGTRLSKSPNELANSAPAGTYCGFTQREIKIRSRDNLRESVSQAPPLGLWWGAVISRICYAAPSNISRTIADLQVSVGITMSAFYDVQDAEREEVAEGFMEVEDVTSGGAADLEQRKDTATIERDKRKIEEEEKANRAKNAAKEAQERKDKDAQEKEEAERKAKEADSAKRDKEKVEIDAEQKAVYAERDKVTALEDGEEKTKAEKALKDREQVLAKRRQEQESKETFILASDDEVAKYRVPPDKVAEMIENVTWADAKKAWVERWLETDALGLFETPAIETVSLDDPAAVAAATRFPSSGLPEINRRLFDVLSDRANQNIIAIESAAAKAQKELNPPLPATALISKAEGDGITHVNGIHTAVIQLGSYANCFIIADNNMNTLYVNFQLSAVPDENQNLDLDKGTYSLLCQLAPATSGKGKLGTPKVSLAFCALDDQSVFKILYTMSYMAKTYLSWGADGEDGCPPPPPTPSSPGQEGGGDPRQIEDPKNRVEAVERFVKSRGKLSESSWNKLEDELEAAKHQGNTDEVRRVKKKLHDEKIKEIQWNVAALKTGQGVNPEYTAYVMEGDELFGVNDRKQKQAELLSELKKMEADVRKEMQQNKDPTEEDIKTMKKQRDHLPEMLPDTAKAQWVEAAKAAALGDDPLSPSAPPTPPPTPVNQKDEWLSGAEEKYPQRRPDDVVKPPTLPTLFDEGEPATGKKAQLSRPSTGLSTGMVEHPLQENNGDVVSTSLSPSVIVADPVQSSATVSAAAVTGVGAAPGVGVVASQQQPAPIATPVAPVVVTGSVSDSSLTPPTSTVSGLYDSPKGSSIASSPAVEPKTQDMNIEALAQRVEGKGDIGALVEVVRANAKYVHNTLASSGNTQLTVREHLAETRMKDVLEAFVRIMEARGKGPGSIPESQQAAVDHFDIERFRNKMEEIESASDQSTEGTETSTRGVQEGGGDTDTAAAALVDAFSRYMDAVRVHGEYDADATTAAYKKLLEEIARIEAMIPGVDTPKDTGEDAGDAEADETPRCSRNPPSSAPSEENAKRKVYICGYSVGGALASLFTLFYSEIRYADPSGCGRMPYFPSNVLPPTTILATFGAPPCGTNHRNAWDMQSVNRKMQNYIDGGAVVMRRYVTQGDPIPRLVPDDTLRSIGYTHMGNCCGTSVVRCPGTLNTFDSFRQTLSDGISGKIPEMLRRGKQLFSTRNYDTKNNEIDPLGCRYWAIDKVDNPANLKKPEQHADQCGIMFFIPLLGLYFGSKDGTARPGGETTGGPGVESWRDRLPVSRKQDDCNIYIPYVVPGTTDQAEYYQFSLYGDTVSPGDYCDFMVSLISGTVVADTLIDTVVNAKYYDVMKTWGKRGIKDGSELKSKVVNAIWGGPYGSRQSGYRYNSVYGAVEAVIEFKRVNGCAYKQAPGSPISEVEVQPGDIVPYPPDPDAQEKKNKGRELVGGLRRTRNRNGKKKLVRTRRKR